MLKFKLSVLDNFYKNINQLNVRNSFLDMAQIRAKGYGPEYSPTYLSLDASDFVGWHYLLYVQDELSAKKNQWLPMSCWRHTSLKRCDTYRITPPFLATVRDANIQPHLELMETLISECRQKDQDLIYLGGFTVVKPFRGDRQLGRVVKEIVASTLVLDRERVRRSVLISGGALRLNTHHALGRMGYEPFQWQGEKLGSFEKKAAFGAPMILLRLKAFTPWVMNCYQKHRHLLIEREEIGGADILDLEIQKKAA